MQSRPRSLPLSLLALLVATTLSACAVGPDYASGDAPGAVLPARYAHAGAAAQADPQASINQQASSEALRQWWSGFHDPVLDRIIDRVLAQNLDLQAALSRVEQARAVAQLADAALLPSASANLQVQQQRQSLRSPLGQIASNFPGYERNHTQYDLGLGASWEIDLFGGLHRQREADLASAEAAAADGLGVRISLAAEAADAYFRLRGAQARLQVLEQQIVAERQLSELVALRLQDGFSNRRELAQAQARLAGARAAVTPVRAEIEVQRNRLDVLMGAAPGSLATQWTSDAPTMAAAPSLDALPAPAQLLRRRPDVMAAERRLAASNARIGVAMSEYYPKLSLSGLLGFESLSRFELSERTLQPTAVAGLRWRLFDFGRVDAEVAAAKGAHAEDLSRFRQAMLKATEDVENALVNESEVDQRRLALQQQKAASEEALRAVTEAFDHGAESRVEVLEQTRQLLAAQDQLIVAEADSARASVGLYRALGGGW